MQTDPMYLGDLPGYPNPEAPGQQWWVMCPTHEFWAFHGGSIGHRTTHCPMCPHGTSFDAHEAGPSDPVAPPIEQRLDARKKVWRKFNAQRRAW